MSSNQRKFMKAYEVIFQVLVEAQEERELRRDPISGDMGWVLYERLVVWGEVNRLRAQQEKAFIPVKSILMAESSANGHVDYTHKFALRAAELVFTDAK